MFEQRIFRLLWFTVLHVILLFFYLNFFITHPKLIQIFGYIISQFFIFCICSNFFTSDNILKSIITEIFKETISWPFPCLFSCFVFLDHILEIFGLKYFWAPSFFVAYRAFFISFNFFNYFWFLEIVATEKLTWLIYKILSYRTDIFSNLLFMILLKILLLTLRILGKFLILIFINFKVLFSFLLFSFRIFN